MPKKKLKSYIPSPEKIAEIKSLQFLGHLLQEPNLWHFNRHSVAKAFLVGLFCSMIPIPFQMVLSAFIAVRVNCNLPISIALVWISNPITMPPIFYFNYLVGTWILRKPPIHYDMNYSFDWIMSKLVEIGIPLYFGSVIVGLVLGAIAYFSIHFLWKRKVKKDWKARQQRRAARNS
jgi:uncharacterized protein (DUF2062 family)